MINDNRHLVEWPESKVIKAEDNEFKRLDSIEPYEQTIDLECGHWLMNCYGLHYKKYNVGDKIRCRTCGLNNGNT